MLNIPVTKICPPFSSANKPQNIKAQSNALTPLSKSKLYAVLISKTHNKQEINRITALSLDNNGQFNPQKAEVISAVVKHLFPQNFNNNSNLNAQNVSKILALITDNNGNINYDCIGIIKALTPSQNSFQASCNIFETIRNKNGTIDNNKITFMKSIIKKIPLPVNSVSKNDFHYIFTALSDKNGKFNPSAGGLFTKIALKKDYLTHQDINKYLLLIQNCKHSNGDFSANKLKAASKIVSADLSQFENSPQVIQLCLNENGEFDEKLYKNFRVLLRHNNDTNVMSMAVDIKQHLNPENIEKLNFHQKRDLLQRAFPSCKFSTIPDDKKAGSVKKTYINMLAKISNDLGLNVKELTNFEKKSFFRALDNLDNPGSAFYNADFNRINLDLAYCEKDFVQDILNTTKHLSLKDKKQVYDFYSFEIIKNNEGTLILNGFPNTSSYDTSHLTPAQYHAVKDIRTFVDKFANKNHIIIQGNKQLENELNALISPLPEFYTLTGSKHHNSRALHTLKVLQETIKNPYYKTLSKSNQRMLKNCTLLHEISNEDNSPSEKRPLHSAFDAFYLTSKLGYKYPARLKIYQIIKNQDWFSRYAQKEVSAKDVAFELRQDDSFKMCNILNASDLKAQSGSFKYEDYFKKAAYEIQYYVDMLKKTAIHLPQTTIPKASNIPASKYVKKETHDGITNTILYVNPNLDLSKVGFKNLSDVNDLNLLLHGLKSDIDSSRFQILGNLDSDGILSSSYMMYSQRNIRTIYPQGFILKVASDDIHVADGGAYASGMKKDFNTLKNNYLFRDNPHRNYVSSLIKSKMNISDSQYAKLFPEIANKPIEVLRKTNPQFAKAMEEIFPKMWTYYCLNEILVSRPQIQGVFCFDKDIKNLPKYLREYAEENDVPILVLSTL